MGNIQKLPPLHELWREILEIAEICAPANTVSTLPKTNMAYQKWWLGEHFPFGFPPIFRGYVNFREGSLS